MKRIAVITRDEYLYKKIALSLEGCSTDMLTSEEGIEAFDRVFLDLDAFPVGIEGAVTMSRGGECILPIPFALDAPMRYISCDEAARLIPNSREVRFGGRTVRLTELEYALLALLVEAGGEPVSRETILDRVWQGDADGGIVNVYIHYLREKLETEGERIIAASRGKGYSLTEKYAAAFRREKGGDNRC